MGKLRVDAAGERRRRGGKISPGQTRALCGQKRAFDSSLSAGQARPVVTVLELALLQAL
jgi:hypothetical protein